VLKLLAWFWLRRFGRTSAEGLRQCACSNGYRAGMVTL
jgi:hypothetical protein